MKITHKNVDKEIPFSVVECGKTFIYMHGGDSNICLKIFNPVKLDNGRHLNAVDLGRAIPLCMDLDFKVTIVDSELTVTHS